MAQPVSTFQVHTLTEAFAKAHAATLLGFSDDLAWDDWTTDNLLYPLPEKWRHSRYVAAPDGPPVAYAIISRKQDSLHLHHIVVKPDYRSGGAPSLGRLLVDDLVASARAAGCARVTLKVMAENPRAASFYLRYGFQEKPSGAAGVRALEFSL